MNGRIRIAAMWGFVTLCLLLPAERCAVAQEGASGNPYADDPRVTVHRDIVYGKDDPGQQILDAWLLESDRPTPVMIRIHAGWGFSRAAMRDFTRKREPLFRALKDAGFSVVSITHRDAAKHGFPAPMLDTARAVQFVRSKARQWNIDPERIVAMGGSGGGHCATWVALHDDFRDPDSADPVARQSSRLQAVIPMWTPVDFTRFSRSGKGWKRSVAAMVAEAEGWPVEDYNWTPESRETVKQLTLTSYVSKDDPPVLLIYEATDAMVAADHPPAAETIDDPHDGWHGVLLADALRKAGVPFEFYHGGTRTRAGAVSGFLARRLGQPKSGAGPAEPSLYGVYAWASSYVQYADDIHAMGVRWVRIAGWHAVDDREKAMLMAAERDTRLVPVLMEQSLRLGESAPLEEALPAWRKVVRENVARYGPGGSFWAEHRDSPALPVRTWEIWNEPDIGFLNPSATGLDRPELYARLLEVAAEEIRAVDPRARIIAFNLAGGINPPEPYKGSGRGPDEVDRRGYMGFRKFIRETNRHLDRLSAYDAVGLHPYTQPKSPDAGGVIEGLEALAELAREQGFADKPIWLTEVGYPLEYPHGIAVRDERQQAAFLARLFALSAAHGVAQVQVMYVEDIIFSSDNSRRSFGLFTAPGKWRMQAAALETMIDLLPEPSQPQILAERRGGQFAYRFRGTNGWPVIVAWNSGSGEIPHTFKLPAGPVTRVDVLGRSVDRLERIGRTVTVPLGEAPIYLVPAEPEAVRAALADGVQAESHPAE